MTELTPLALQDAPALIERVFPAQKVSFEAQRERKAGAGQTLTALGSYWKGRKPLILVRAIVLGSLLPQTDDAEADLEIFERLMAFDYEGLARRALIQKALKPKDIAARIKLNDPWTYFNHNIKRDDNLFEDVAHWTFPLDCDDVHGCTSVAGAGSAGATEERIKLRWRRDATEEDKLKLYRKTLATFASYEEKAALCKRPEEVGQAWLYAPVWPAVNRHYEHLGIEAYSHQQLIEQLGILRYGHRPRVGDTFSGGGSIPFEAARLGCDVYASDLNPIACMLTWGALNIIGASPERRAEIEQAQREVAEKVDKEITALGIEHDEQGNRAKAYLYCLETRCPETGWMVPMSPSWIISKTRNVVAKLIPDHENQRFDIEVVTGASKEEMKEAAKGTVQDGNLIYELDGKTWRTPIKTLRGDYRDAEGNTGNRLRRWEKHDFMPRPDDIFQERLYAIQWITRETLDKPRQKTFFTSVTEADLERERKVERIVAENLARWQEEGLVPDMEIEPGDKTDEPIRTRGWTYWHHLFTPRNLIAAVIVANHLNKYSAIGFCDLLNFNAKLCRWTTSPKSTGKAGGRTGGASDNATDVFSNQALNTFYNYAHRSAFSLTETMQQPYRQRGAVTSDCKIQNHIASAPRISSELWVTDPPYADAVHYHEITEFFIAWLHKNPPAPFDQWTWDSRRALAIKGSGDDFRRGMVDAYRAMTDHMPDNGMQCVMFTHQDTGVWSDMVGIFWAAGLRVVAAWYIATETTSQLKKGGYVQGTVILMLRKRPAGDWAGFKQRILPAVRTEVKRQIETMMHLNDEVKDKMGEPVFNDSDLQMAGYAAALKVLTAYTQVGGEDATTFAMRPRRRGEVTVVDEIVQQAAEAANSLLVPEQLSADTWHKLNGIQRFYLRMMDMESTGASKLDNYQNFAKAFRVVEYTRVMANMTANKARLKHVTDFVSRDLTESTELGATWLGRLIIGLQQLLAETEPQVVIGQLQAELPDFMEVRPLLIDILGFIEKMAPEEPVREAAEVLGARLRNLRALGQ
jgi:adenine-specific DNA methylase